MKKFFSELLKDDTGKFSMTRFTQLLLISMYCGAVILNLYTQGKFPDIPANLAMFLWGLYFANKIGSNFPKFNKS